MGTHLPPVGVVVNQGRRVQEAHLRSRKRLCRENHPGRIAQIKLVAVCSVHGLPLKRGGQARDRGPRSRAPAGGKKSRCGRRPRRRQRKLEVEINLPRALPDRLRRQRRDSRQRRARRAARHDTDRIGPRSKRPAPVGEARTCYISERAKLLRDLSTHLKHDRPSPRANGPVAWVEQGGVHVDSSQVTNIRCASAGHLYTRLHPLLCLLNTSYTAQQVQNAELQYTSIITLWVIEAEILIVLATGWNGYGDGLISILHHTIPPINGAVLNQRAARIITHHRGHSGARRNI